MTSEAEQKVLDGRVWDEFCDALKEAGKIVRSEKAPGDAFNLSLIHISEPTRLVHSSRMPSSA